MAQLGDFFQSCFERKHKVKIHTIKNIANYPNTKREKLLSEWSRTAPAEREGLSENRFANTRQNSKRHLEQVTLYKYRNFIVDTIFQNQ